MCYFLRSSSVVLLQLYVIPLATTMFKPATILIIVLVLLTTSAFQPCALISSRRVADGASTSSPLLPTSSTLRLFENSAEKEKMVKRYQEEKGMTVEEAEKEYKDFKSNPYYSLEKGEVRALTARIATTTQAVSRSYEKIVGYRSMSALKWGMLRSPCLRTPATPFRPHRSTMHHSAMAPFLTAWSARQRKKERAKRLG